MNYRKSHTAPGYGKSYDRTFIEMPYRRAIWRMEKIVLNRIVGGLGKSSGITHLDFACGTGRVISFLEVLTHKSMGIDISPSMLEIARQNVSSELIEADITQSNPFSGQQFDLITSFRFFPNAEPELREDVMAQLVSLVSNNGRLVFNNHRNTDSFFASIKNRFSGTEYPGMSRAEVENLIEKFGFEVDRVFSLGIFPDSFSPKIIPSSVLFCFEKIFLKVMNSFRLGYDEIYVCKRK